MFTPCASLMVNNYHASNFLDPLLLFMYHRSRKHGDIDYFCNTNDWHNVCPILQANILFAFFPDNLNASIVKNLLIKGMQLLIVTIYMYIHSFNI